MFGWWRTFEHFSVPGSQPIATSSDLARVEQHAREHTASYRKHPVIAETGPNGEWLLRYVLYSGHRDEQDRMQSERYEIARGGGSRGGLGVVPPVGETTIISVDLDEAVSAPALWMEIRRPENDETLGIELYATELRDDGGRKPAFARVMSVRPGDRILHWWQRGIVGSSVVASSPEAVQDGVLVELEKFVRFPAPVTLEAIRDVTDDVVSVYENTRDDPAWSQFPFQINPGPPIEIHGAPTTYFAPVPPTLVEVIPGLERLIEWSDATVTDTPPDVQTLGVAFENDPLRRRAIELYAEDEAIELLRRVGYTGIERIGKPYDIKAFQDDKELHVEVKGSSRPVEAVILTRNEVAHASEAETTLIVVDEIVVEWTVDGYECSGGKRRRWDRWTPSPQSLKAIQYTYDLPVD